MSHVRHIKRYIQPVLEAHKFRRVARRMWLHEETPEWATLCVIQSGSHGQGQQFFNMDFGVFSHMIERVLERHRVLGIALDLMPASLMECAIEFDFAELMEDLTIGPPEKVKIFQTDEDPEPFYEALVARLETLLPRIIEDLQSLEAVAERHDKRWGRCGIGGPRGLMAATANILLGRYDRAEEILGATVRPGSLPLIKKEGARLREMIERARK